MILQQKTVRETLHVLMELHAITETELARRSKVPQPTIHRLLSGATPDPRLSSLKPLAKYFNISLGQLVGEEPLITEIQGNINIRSLVKVPLLPWEKAHEWKKLTEDYIPSNWIYWTTINQPISPHSYALLIENRHLPLPFSYQTVIIIDPEINIKDGNFLVIYRISDRSITIKKLSIDGADKWLVPLNEKINALLYDKDFLLCGTITQANLPLISAG